MKLNAATMNWYVLHCAKKLGLWGWLGLLVILFSYYYYQSNVKAINAETAQLVLDKTRVEQELNMPELMTEAPKMQEANDEDIARFYDRFPEVGALPEVLQTINQLALKQRVALNSGDYKLDQLKQNSSAAPKTLSKYQISFPVVGHYQDVRRFSATVLNKLPGIALTDMQIKRETTTDNQVEASLVYVLFVKGKAW